MHHVIRTLALLAAATATTAAAPVLPAPPSQAAPRLLGPAEIGIRF
ncbi:hypothetical protein [Kitasatospora sp. NPDC085464]